MEFSKQLWQEAETIYQKTLALNFFQDLLSGDLSQDRFHNYLQQDMLYLHHYAKAISATAAKAPCRTIQSLLQGFSDEVLEGELALHRRYVAALPTATAETKCYNDFLIQATETGDFFIGIAAILPCYWFYQKIASSINTAPDHPYQEWITSYANEYFYQQLASLCKILDEEPQLDKKILSKTFQQACECEYQFHRKF